MRLPLDSTSALRTAAVALPTAYVLLVGWAMWSLTYDIWGALIIAPVLPLVSVPLLRRLFAGQDPATIPIAIAGLVAHMAGSVARYWVAFDAYGGSADAERYHAVGKEIAGTVRGDFGRIALVIPRPTGTPFIEKLTGLVYTFIGSSRMAGFLVFGWFAFVGTCFFIRAAFIGVRGLAQRRYAIVVLFLPSLIYWPSSIGKESWMLLTLGIASYGFARLFTMRRWTTAVTVSVIGLGAAACVRPHVAAIWGAGAALATVVTVIVRRQRVASMGLARVAATVLLALLGAFAVGRIAIDYLDPGDADESATVTERVDSILESTEGRTTIGGSGFTPPPIDRPTQWPFAIVRTLTRPLLIEANSVSSLLPALEMTALLVLCALSLDRLRSLPKMVATVPYVSFAVTTTVLFGLAFSSFGNLAILTRQRSLILPLLILPLCLPRRRPVRRPPVPASVRRPLARTGRQ